MFLTHRKSLDTKTQDRAFKNLIKLFSCSIFILFGLLFYHLLLSAWPALSKMGFSFFFNQNWNPVTLEFGVLSFVFGTLVSSAIALLIAAPISIGSALVLVELSSGKVSRICSFLIEMLAAIPSIVYGLWGLFIVAPWVRDSLGPVLKENFGFLPFFQGPIFGVSLLTAGLILSIMIIPTITSISKEIFKTISRDQKEAALALGATRSEMIQTSLLKGTRKEIFGALILGLGRALGETMAVTMVIGNRSSDISLSLFAPSQTMASVIANEYTEATEPIHLSALAGVGFVLLLISLITFSLSYWIVRSLNLKFKKPKFSKRA